MILDRVVSEARKHLRVSICHQGYYEQQLTRHAATVTDRCRCDEALLSHTVYKAYLEQNINVNVCCIDF